MVEIPKYAGESPYRWQVRSNRWQYCGGACLENGKKTAARGVVPAILAEKAVTKAVIASAAKQSILPSLRWDGLLRCARNDG